MLKSFSISDKAANRIKYLAEKEDNPKKKILRISVDGGGCSGFQYNFTFVETKNKDDLIIEKNGAQVVIDEISLNFLQNEEKGASTLDFVQELGAEYFTIKNPLATANCGCGNSFSV